MSDKPEREIRQAVVGYDYSHGAGYEERVMTLSCGHTAFVRCPPLKVPKTTICLECTRIARQKALDSGTDPVM